MHNFTPVSALAGGVLIGIATVLYLVLTGRYAGISGIMRGAAFGDADRVMDVLFVAGLVLGGVVWFAFARISPAASWNAPWWLVAAGGILVGFGTSLGRGCTSGHGVCGLGRLSRRSLVAVVAFVASGMITVFVVRHMGLLS